MATGAVLTNLSSPAGIPAGRDSSTGPERTGPDRTGPDRPVVGTGYNSEVLNGKPFD